MEGLTIGWEYLTGYAVATDPSDRARAEWPPHPARVFMALAAAWFETDEDASEGNALRWLERLEGEPELRLPPLEAVTGRSLVTVYVPVNDSESTDLARNRVYREIVEADSAALTSSRVTGWIKAINRASKTAVVTATACRIELAVKLQSLAMLPDRAESEPWRPFLSQLADQIRAIPFKDFATDGLALIPVHRTKQPRTFPRIRVGFAPCCLHWPNVSDVEQHRDALDRLCGKVTRIGHSSSLVRMWVEDHEPPASDATERWVSDNVLGEFQLRRTSPGMLDMLVDRYGEKPRQRHGQLTRRIAALKAEKKTIQGKGAAAHKAAVDQRIGDAEQERETIVYRPPVRPAIGLWSGYRREDREPALSDRPHSHFDTDVLVLTNVDGPPLPLVATIGVTATLRKALMSQCEEVVPPWLSGHEPNGDPLRDENGHLALIPLPFVGRPHADGHLLGVGLVFPRTLDRRGRGKVLGSVLLEEDGRPKRVELAIAGLGSWVVQKRDWSERRHTLQSETWTAHPDGADTWASVTPVLLDRFPKQDRTKNRAEWSAEVAEIIRAGCERIGLPRPVAVDIDTTSWHVGSPRAIGKRRRLRGTASVEPDQEAPLGDGFPAYPAKGSRASRPQVHAWLRFDEPVVGPVLLGAGRYRGYGLFKPWKGAQHDST